jgi:hypothetical protein
MATTTNFGWVTPDNTDLVKDGASAIRTLGSSIDSSMGELKGGTTGQVLAKASNADMDFVWSADAAGMTNPMTTTGDTIYSSSGSTPARLGVGTTGQVLTVAGGVPTWASPSASGNTLITSGSTFSGTAQTISSIPQTYKHLKFTFWDMRTTSGTGSKFHLTFNGAGGSYTYRRISFTNATVSASPVDPDNELVIGTSLVANTYATTGVIDILDYASTTNYKTGIWTAAGRQDAGSQLMNIGAFQNNSNTAISSIVLNVNNAWNNGYWELWGIA